MNSCLYECNVMHCRVEPKHHKFNHKTYMFYLDLDEVDMISKNLALFSVDKGNIFSFMMEDHTDFGGKTVEKNIRSYLNEKGVEHRVKRIMLLTHLKTFGYIFNPVSFYYCFDENDKPVCSVVEITNTFREMKLFYLGPDTLTNNQFKSEQKKYFYISPFIDLDVPMDYHLKVPKERLDIRIDDLREHKKFFYSSLTGKSLELNNANLWWMGIKYPLITLKVIFLIHAHAGILHFIKKVPYHSKKDNPQLQKEVQRAIH